MQPAPQDKAGALSLLRLSYQLRSSKDMLIFAGIWLTPLFYPQACPPSLPHGP